MHGKKGPIILGLCTFLLGVSLGSLRNSWDERKSDGSPVSVDLCFLFRNPDLIGSRRFITSARIASAFPHGSVLESDSCPKRGAGFSEQLDHQNFEAELTQRFKNDPYGSVPVLFEGTLYRPSLFRRVWFTVVNRFGIRDQTAPITIRRYRAVGNQGDPQLIQLPDSHP
jgi:hypothetical protein